MVINGFLVFPCKDSFGLVYKLYSSDCKNFYGDFYSEDEVYNKVYALRKEGLKGVSL